MVKSQNKAKYTRKAGNIFPAFSFFRLSSKGSFLIVFGSLLLCFSCRPKTGSDLQSNEPITIVDSIAIVDGTPIDMETGKDTIVETTVIEEVIDPIPQLLLSFSKKGCYGNCPEYDFKMFSNGHLVYVGQAKVKNLGNYEARIDPLRIYKIYQIADQYQFFQMDNFYPKNGKLIGELPSTHTFLKKEAIEKTIHNNHDSPAELRKFESFLEDWINTILWNKMDQ